MLSGDICLQYKAVEITSQAVEQDSVVYKISMPKFLNFISYFNRRPVTWLLLMMILIQESYGILHVGYNIAEIIVDYHQATFLH